MKAFIGLTLAALLCSCGSENSSRVANGSHVQFQMPDSSGALSNNSDFDAFTHDTSPGMQQTLASFRLPNWDAGLDVFEQQMQTMSAAMETALDENASGGSERMVDGYDGLQGALGAAASRGILSAAQKERFLTICRHYSDQMNETINTHAGGISGYLHKTEQR